MIIDPYFSLTFSRYIIYRRQYEHFSLIFPMDRHYCGTKRPRQVPQEYCRQLMELKVRSLPLHRKGNAQ